jgi:uncharacterized coiled-coil DUF342 family protein
MDEDNNIIFFSLSRKNKIQDTKNVMNWIQDEINDLNNLKNITVEITNEMDSIEIHEAINKHIDRIDILHEQGERLSTKINEQHNKDLNKINEYYNLMDKINEQHNKELNKIDEYYNVLDKIHELDSIHMRNI